MINLQKIQFIVHLIHYGIIVINAVGKDKDVSVDVTSQCQTACSVADLRGKIVNGKILEDNNSEMITYECDNGHALHGGKVREKVFCITEEKDGRNISYWQDVGQCEVLECKTFLSVANTLTVYNMNMNHGDPAPLDHEVYYMCDDQYRFPNANGHGDPNLFDFEDRIRITTCTAVYTSNDTVEAAWVPNIPDCSWMSTSD